MASILSYINIETNISKKAKSNLELYTLFLFDMNT